MNLSGCRTGPPQDSEHIRLETCPQSAQSKTADEAPAFTEWSITVQIPGPVIVHLRQGLTITEIHAVKAIGDSEGFKGLVTRNITGDQPIHMSRSVRTFVQKEHQMPGKSILDVEPIHAGMLPAEAGCRRAWSV